MTVDGQFLLSVVVIIIDGSFATNWALVRVLNMIFILFKEGVQIYQGLLVVLGLFAAERVSMSFFR